MRINSRRAMMARMNGDVPLNGAAKGKYFLIRKSDGRGLAYGVTREALQGLQAFLESGGTACEIRAQSGSKGYTYRIDGSRNGEAAA